MQGVFAELEPRSQGAEKGGKQKEFDRFFVHVLVTFSDASVIFFVVLCRSPFAELLLWQGEKEKFKFWCCTDSALGS